VAEKAERYRSLPFSLLAYSPYFDASARCHA